jgi:hypothetical protein
VEVVWTGLSEKGRAVCVDRDLSGAERESETQGGREGGRERASERVREEREERVCWCEGGGSEGGREGKVVGES